MIKKVKLGHEHGVVVYEVFYLGDTKFEYLKNANNHAIMEWKKGVNRYRKNEIKLKNT